MRSEVTVVIPCFNAVTTLGRALQSIAHQTVRAKEVIIVDDGSDNFPEVERVVSLFSSELNVRLHRLPKNGGAPAARNAGINTANTELIALLDADDFWARSKLEIQLRIMSETEASLSCHYYRANTSLKDLGDKHADRSIKRLTLKDFVWRNPVVTPTVMFKRQAAPIFDVKLARCDDFKAWIEAVHSGERFVLLRTVLAGGGKPPLGHSGLTGSVYEMHAATLQCLDALREKATVPLKFILAAAAVERLKYPIRRFTMFLRR